MDQSPWEAYNLYKLLDKLPTFLGTRWFITEVTKAAIEPTPKPY
jgi:hypothetical protein